MIEKFDINLTKDIPRKENNPFLDKDCLKMIKKIVETSPYIKNIWNGPN